MIIMPTTTRLQDQARELMRDIDDYLAELDETSQPHNESE